jgi:hypothetical protein
MHLVYEDFKLNLVTQKYIQPLSHLLSCLAKSLKWDAYREYYVNNIDDSASQPLLEGLCLLLKGIFNT